MSKKLHNRTTSLNSAILDGPNCQILENRRSQLGRNSVRQLGKGNVENLPNIPNRMKLYPFLEPGLYLLQVLNIPIGYYYTTSMNKVLLYALIYRGYALLPYPADWKNPPAQGDLPSHR